MSTVSLPPSSLSKLTLTMTLSRIVGTKSHSVIGMFTSSAFMDLTQGEMEGELGKEKGGKVKNDRGKINLTWEFNRNSSKKATTEEEEVKGKEETTIKDEAETEEATTPKEATSIDPKVLFKFAAKDPVLGKAMMDPKFQPYIKAITANPSLLSNSMGGLKEMTEKDEEGKDMAGMVIQRLGVVIGKMAKENKKAKEEKEIEGGGASEDAKSTTSVGKIMYSNQSDLPKLPLPDLDNTKKMLLECLEPVAKDETWEETERKVEVFFKEQVRRREWCMEYHMVHGVPPLPLLLTLECHLLLVSRRPPTFTRPSQRSTRITWTRRGSTRSTLTCT